MDLLTTSEVADLLKVNRKTIYKLITEESFPVVKVLNENRFNRADVESWIRAHSSGASDEK